MKQNATRPLTKAQRRRAFRRRRRRILAVLIVILMILSALLIAGGIFISQKLGLVHFGNNNSGFVDSLEADPMDPDYSGTIINDPVDINDTAKSVSDITAQGNTKSITNILLVGVETNDQNNYIGRSDCMMIMTLDKYNKTIKLTSLLRDIYVSIPNHGYNKLNASWAFGGFDLLSQTIEKNFRIKIDEYVAVNFSAFAKAVDAMGGLDMDLDADEAQYTGAGKIAGSYNLNGEETLRYTRIRYYRNTDGSKDDWGRTSRQRVILQKLIEKAKSMSIGTMNTVLDQVFPEIYTNMKADEFTKYIVASPTYLKYQVTEYYVPHYGEFDSDYVKGVGDVLALKNAKSIVIELQHQIYGQ